MNDPLTPQAAFELVQRLREAHRDTAARELALLRDFDRLRAQLRKEVEGTEQRIAADQTISETRLEESLAAESSRLKAWHDGRKARLVRAHRTSRRKEMEAIDQIEGRASFTIQKGTLDAERRRDEGMAKAKLAHKEFTETLRSTFESFGALEDRAARLFRGYATFRRWLDPNHPWPPPPLDDGEELLLQRLRDIRTATGSDLDRFQSAPLPAVFRIMPLGLWLALVVLAAGAMPFGNQLGLQSMPVPMAMAAGAGAIALVAAAYWLGRHLAWNGAERIASNLATARWLNHAATQKSESTLQNRLSALAEEFNTTLQRLNDAWDKSSADVAVRRKACVRDNDDRLTRLAAQADHAYSKVLGRLETNRAGRHAELVRQAARDAVQLKERARQSAESLDRDQAARWQALESGWQSAVTPLLERISKATDAARSLAPAWDDAGWNTWEPATLAQEVVRFGTLDVDVGKLVETAPKDRRLGLPGPSRFSIPLILAGPPQGSLTIDTDGAADDLVIGTLNNVVDRLILGAPPGRLSLTVIDPAGLGSHFAGLSHLADYEESGVHSRIWTQTSQIEERLGHLCEHIEKVIQMYLRNEYPTIVEYNRQAGVTAEKNHVLVIADFPLNFSETAARRLLNILVSGPRCGVRTLLHWNRRLPMPHEFLTEPLRRSGVCISVRGAEVTLADRSLPGIAIRLDPPPPVDLASRLLQAWGELGRKMARVEVPFDVIAPAASEMWREETTEELRVPVGRTGATKMQYLSLGTGTRQHVLVAGKTGSGKSTLFHVMITNLALRCSPEQVAFYLVDFKKGVEFKAYATHHLPHARVIAIESDRGFALSVLECLDEELRRRGDLFRRAGAQDLPAYKRSSGALSMPRCLLIIDEFQEFFVEEDRISQGAAVLLDRLVRQGRAFGIHVILGSQTLGGAYTLARATLGQMAVRIALQCNEADSYLIMDENNPAPRLLSRPGEGIYNDMAGSREANSPFQVVWLAENERERRLEAIEALAKSRPMPFQTPFVFEGNAPADVSQNEALENLIGASRVGAAKPTSPHWWIGAPNAIKGPTEIPLRQQSGSHVLVVGQRDDAMLAMISIGLVTLAAQYAPGAVEFVILDGSPNDSSQRAHLNRMARRLVHPCELAGARDAAAVLKRLSDRLQAATGEDGGGELPAVFVFVIGLQNHRTLRQEDDYSFAGMDAAAEVKPAVLMERLLENGPTRGLHVICSCDTVNNLNRFLGRKAQAEFGLRVLFQMSATDSASLVDTPEASTLGLHRALLFDEREGRIEIFRPYAMPENAWLERALPGAPVARMIDGS